MRRYRKRHDLGHMTGKAFGDTLGFIILSPFYIGAFLLLVWLLFAFPMLLVIPAAFLLNGLAKRRRYLNSLKPAPASASAPEPYRFTPVIYTCSCPKCSLLPFPPPEGTCGA